MSSQVRLRLLPRATCMFDDPIQVQVSGLRSRQVVTLKARATDEKGAEFRSSANYRADGGGTVDLARDPSIGGSYLGVQPMGLLWSMTAPEPHRRFTKTKALTPHVVDFSVHGEDGGILAAATNERRLIGAGVQRRTVKEGNIRGVLFTPPGPGPYAGVLDLYTFGGGLSEKRASLLASRGFVVLTIALYGHADMAQDIQEVHLDYFEEAIEYLKKQELVGGNGVGVISLSKSGDLALSVASYLAGVAAVVWINGCSANALLPLYYKNVRILPGLPLDLHKVIVTESGALITKDVIQSPLTAANRATVVPIERAATSRFLFLASKDDLNWDSASYVDMMVDRLRRHGKDNYEAVCYPGAGHYLEPPYGPFCPSSFHALVRKPVLWGGDPESHAAAEVHMWTKVQEFFRTHLNRGDATRTDANL